MNIVVCIKQVPNTKEVRIDQETKNMVRDGVPSILNPHDANALEEGLRLRDLMGGHVTAISMGPGQAAEVLQEALALGADRAILLCDRLFAGADTLATGYALSVAIKELQADLVLCGSEAIDGSTGQVGPIVAENLGWPQLTCIREIEVDGNKIFAVRERREGTERLVSSLPAVACVMKGSNQPQKHLSGGGRLEVFGANDFPFDKNRLGITGSPTRVAHISASDRAASNFVFIDGRLPVEERIRRMMSGGIVPRKIQFVRGSAEELASLILEDVEMKKYI